MGVDRTNDDTDVNAENTQPADQPPPPPPDRPGADGYPSRADSRSGAAMANDAGSQAAEGDQTIEDEDRTLPTSSKAGEVSRVDGSVAESDSEPTGEELVKMEDDAKSRPERLRTKFFEVVGDAHEITGKAAKAGHDIFAHPPTGHAETCTGPEIMAAPREGVDAGDMATGLLVLGTLLGEGVRRYREKSKGKEEGT